MKMAVLSLSALLLTACAKIPDSYAPPEQRKPFGVTSGRLKHYITMNMPEASYHLAEGWVPPLEQSSWRWTLQKPAVRFELPEKRGMKLFVEITLPELTFQQTGPVTISYFVGDHLLEKVKYDKPGQSELLKPVPEEWLSTVNPVIVRMEIDKMWKSPTDGVERGFIVSRIGFQQ